MPVAALPPAAEGAEMSNASVSDVLDFWRTAGPDRWFTRDAAFDAEVGRRLLSAHEAAAAGTLDAWAMQEQGALALVLLLDQVPRNVFRATLRAYATDPLALRQTRAAVARGFDRTCEPVLRQFFYLPFMHSEILADQRRGVALYEAAGDVESAEWARSHCAIIERFGRFPHRNAILGRESSADEQRFLDDGGFAG
jgi:uncharacterized protein (DUF924 family)